ncbi:MAG: flagellar hook-basal body complex protein FliE [Armatimonadetes bacterium]|nr:flagellar hook-basal body complex protein FliE [Armatimonadota bacterium]
MRVSGSHLAGITPRTGETWKKLPDLGDRPEQAGFGKVLAEALRHVNELQGRADREAEKVATGQSRDIHAAIVSMQEAELALELTVQVIQRAIEAYREISRMQM